MDQTRFDHLLDATLERMKSSPGWSSFTPFSDDSANEPGTVDAASTAAFAPQTTSPDPAWPRLPGYTIQRILGQGGMGVVYVGVQNSLNRKVAIKSLNSKYSADADFIQRFRAEARATAKLPHRNIVAIYDVVEHAGLPYIVMEYVSGANLHGYVKNWGVFPYPSACELIIQVADGLQFSHENGLVHRDIKPTNVMLTEKSVVKILDFGIVKHVEAAPSIISQFGQKGTPSFMSPEQERDSSKVDARSDVFSLGLTLVYLLTGKEGKKDWPAGETVAEFLKEIPAPEELVRAIAKMLAEKPADRYQSAKEIAEALRPFVSHPVFVSGTRVGRLTAPAVSTVANGRADVNTATGDPQLTSTGRSVTAGNRLRWFVGISGVAAGLLAIFAAVWLVPALFHTGKTASNDDHSANARNGADGDDRKGGNDPKKPSVPPEMHSSEPGPLDALFVSAGKDLVQFEHEAGLACFAISPSGKMLASASENGVVRLWDLTSGVVAVCPDFPPQWNQGESIVFSDIGFLSETEILICGNFPKPKFHNGYVWDLAKKICTPNLSADKSSLYPYFPIRIFALASQKQNLMVRLDHPGKVIVLERPDGKAISPLSNGKALVSPFSWPAVSADGKRVLADHSGGWNLWDVDAPHRPLSSKFLFPEGEISRPANVPCALSPDGTIGVFASPRNGLTIWDFVNPERPRSLKVAGDNPGEVTSLAYSPTGGFLLSGGSDGKVRLWDMATLKILSVIASHVGPVNQVAFTPDAACAFSSARGGKTVQLVKVTKAALPNKSKGTNEPAKPTDSRPGHVLIAKAGTNHIKFEHKDAVRSFAVSPSGNHLVSGCVDGTVYHWDLSTGRDRIAMSPTPAWPDPAPVTSMVFISETVAMMCVYNTYANNYGLIWDLADGKLVHRMRNADPGNQPKTVVRAGALAIVETAGEAVSLERPKENAAWERVANLTPKNGGNPARTWSASTDGKNILAVERNQFTHWNRDKDNAPTIVKMPGKNRTSGVISSDGKLAYISTDDHRIEEWDLSDLQATEPSDAWDAHTGRITSLAYSPQKDYLLSGSADGTVCLWNAKRGTLIERFTGHEGTVHAVGFSPSADLVISAATDKTVRLWKVSKSAEERVGPILFSGHKGRINSLSFFQDGRKLLSGSDDTTMRLWDVTKAKEWKTFQMRGGSHKVHSTTMSPDAAFAIVAIDGYYLGYQVHDLKSGDSKGHAITDNREHSAVTLDPAEGRFGLAATMSGEIGLFSTNDWKVQRRFQGHKSSVMLLAFSKDAKRFISSGHDKTIRLWDAKKDHDNELCQLPGSGEWHPAVAFSPDGRFIAHSNRENAIHLWDVSDPENPKQRENVGKHTDHVLCLAFSPDGKKLLSGGVDKLVRLWDIETRKSVAIFEGHTNDVTSVAFSPIPGVIASAANDRTIRIWTLLDQK